MRTMTGSTSRTPCGDGSWGGTLRVMSGQRRISTGHDAPVALQSLRRPSAAAAVVVAEVAVAAAPAKPPPADVESPGFATFAATGRPPAACSPRRRRSTQRWPQRQHPSQARALRNLAANADNAVASVVAGGADEAGASCAAAVRAVASSTTQRQDECPRP